ncbi:MAG: DinB family protein [Chloroflexota bacterium]|nr:DinB family protein [Chloroflexota bacterium]
MKVEDIKLYYAYNEWANKRILNAAEQATADQLVAPNDIGWGNLRGALAHILDAEYGWFSFLFGREDEGIIDPASFADIAALRERWERQNEVTRGCLDSLADEDLTRIHTSERGGKTHHWVLWQVLAHVVNHGTQHRAECAAILTGFGHSPGDMDMSLFYNMRDISSSESDAINREDIQLLLRYNDWANDRILNCAEQVTSQQLSAANDFGWGSLRGALVHLMDAEYVWRNLLEDGNHVEWLQPDNFPDVAAIRARWNTERAEFWRYFAGLSDENLSSVISYEGDETRHRVLWHCLAHVVNHGTQHRAECAALLTGFGHSPGNLDFTVFLLED